MKRTVAQTLCLVSIGLACLALAWTATRAAQPVQKRSRAELMREKLNFSKDVLEGLALEQFAKIEKGGKALKKLSQAAEWEVATMPAATDYVMLTTDFQRHADELVKQAQAKNIDGATLAYLKLTMSCVTCHRFIRGAAK
jgi:cytochrome c556